MVKIKIGSGKSQLHAAAITLDYRAEHRNTPAQHSFRFLQIPSNNFFSYGCAACNFAFNFCRFTYNHFESIFFRKIRDH